MTRTHVILILSAAMLSFAACGMEDAQPADAAPEISGALVKVEGCKTFTRAGTDNRSESCVTYRYDPVSASLRLWHRNAGFNCCPKEIRAAVHVENGLIRIAESEAGPNCRCNCLYDLEILIENIQTRNYRVAFEEPYRSGSEAEIEFDVDLADETEGTHCVPRRTYPWGEQ